MANANFALSAYSTINEGQILIGVHLFTLIGLTTK